MAGRTRQLATFVMSRWLLGGVLLTVSAMNGFAEPYLAVDKGLQCSACHSHPAGGGKRTPYGNVFAQTELPANAVQPGNEFWNGQISRWLSVGANLRGRYSYEDSDSDDDSNEFDVTRGTVYIEASLFDDTVSVYVDQQIAPSSTINREAYVTLKGKSLRLTAGQFYLPYGLRLQDDTAFVRRVTGINFTNPDRGVQLGYEKGAWSSALSVTNGSGGGPETDDGKQASLISTHVREKWRVGASVNINESDAGDRTMANVFAGVKTGPVAWLFEIDQIRDEFPGNPDRDGLAGIVEGNWRVRRGHNVKISYEYFDPDTDFEEDHQIRWSALYELTPYPFLQARFGVRLNDGPPQLNGANSEIAFVELHGFF